MRKSIKNLSNIFAEEGQPTPKNIDLVDFMREGSTAKLSASCAENKAIQSIDDSNIRGKLIASVLIVGQYITIFENSRQPTQDALCLSTRSWSSELNILSRFMTSFNECNHKITDHFFKSQLSFIKMGVVTEKQIEEISIGYHKNLTQK